MTLTLDPLVGGKMTKSGGSQVDAIASSYDLCQLIRESTHVLPNSSTCIDLIFINQSNVIVDSGVHASLHPNCHYQIVYATLNLKTESHHYMNG